MELGEFTSSLCNEVETSNIDTKVMEIISSEYSSNITLNNHSET